MIHENIKSWLVGTPKKNINFKWNLKLADNEITRAVLDVVREQLDKTKIKTLKARLCWLKHWRENFEAEKAAYAATVR